MIAALLPMAFVSGLMGPYMGPIPINASMGMLISLAMALIFTPFVLVYQAWSYWIFRKRVTGPAQGEADVAAVGDAPVVAPAATDG